MNTNKDMVDLFRYPSGIAIPSPAVQRWSLILRTRNSQPSGSCKIQKEAAIVISGIRARPLSASIKVPQGNECIETGT